MMRMNPKINKPDDGDDPENRYDCDDCGWAPPADEVIHLADDLSLKLCCKCYAELLESQD